jgi:hypothetical protein
VPPLCRTAPDAHDVGMQDDSCDRHAVRTRPTGTIVTTEQRPLLARRFL